MFNIKRNRIVVLIIFCVCVQNLNAKNRNPSPPYVSGDGFRSVADHVLDDSSPGLFPSKIKKNDIIFVCGDNIAEFCSKYHKKINQKYILVTANSDFDAPGEYSFLLEDKNLIAWFAQNVMNFNHEKLVPIPIGIVNRYGTCGDFTQIDRFAKEFDGWESREHLLYMNFSCNTFPEERNLVFSIFSNSSYCTRNSNLSFSKYLEYISKSKFVLSPRGTGLDCHRTWESLYLGAIPIVKTSSSDSMFEDLPVLIIDSWNDLSEGYLEQKYEEFSQRFFNFKKLYLDYWIQIILDIKSKN